MVTPFADGQTHLGRGDHFQHCRLGQIFLIVQLNTVSKLLGRAVTDRRVQHHPIGLLAVVARGGDAMRPLAVVGHQHQSGRIDIQTPGSVQLVGDRLVDEIEHRRVIGIVG
ncbi:hypothetical protein D3C75_1030630 [compost metagenome]